MEILNLGTLLADGESKQNLNLALKFCLNKFNNIFIIIILIRVSLRSGENGNHKSCLKGINIYKRKTFYNL